MLRPLTETLSGTTLPAAMHCLQMPAPGNPLTAHCDPQSTRRTSYLMATLIWRPACLAGSRASPPAWRSALSVMRA